LEIDLIQSVVNDAKLPIVDEKRTSRFFK